MNPMPLFSGLKGMEYQLSVVIFDVRPHWIRRRTSHNNQLQYLSNAKTPSNLCCINLGHTEPDGVQVTVISYNIYQTLKLLATRVV